jgi:hypothetical protein
MEKRILRIHNFFAEPDHLNQKHFRLRIGIRIHDILDGI